MNKMKDFLYDKNDIIVALLILGLAAAIIYLRIGDIMHYPESSAKGGQSTVTTSQENTLSGTQGTSQETKSTARTITISSNATSKSVSEQLEKAGFIPSALDFENALKKYNLTGYIQTGTFEIPEDATTIEIIEIITRRNVT